jgi:hypothetical protein
MTMTREQFEETNRNAPIPPAFGEGKPWLLRSVAYETKDGSIEALIPSGFRVQKRMHAFYWAEVATYTDLLAAAKAVGFIISTYALLDSNDKTKLIGIGQLDPDDGAHEMAFLACMFLESINCSIGFELPEGFDASTVRNALSMQDVIAEKEASE